MTVAGTQRSGRTRLRTMRRRRASPWLGHSSSTAGRSASVRWTASPTGRMPPRASFWTRSGSPAAPWIEGGGIAQVAGGGRAINTSGETLALGAVTVDRLPGAAPCQQPAWLALAAHEIGTRESGGKASKPMLVRCFTDAGFSGVKDWASDQRGTPGEAGGGQCQDRRRARAPGGAEAAAHSIRAYASLTLTHRAAGPSADGYSRTRDPAFSPASRRRAGFFRTSNATMTWLASPPPALSVKLVSLQDVGLSR